MSMFDMMPFEHRNHLSYNPFRDLENWERSFFGDWSSGFNTDIKDKGDHYELEADLPGVKKEDIAVDIDGDRMTISAHRSAETEEKDDNSQYQMCIRDRKGPGLFHHPHYAELFSKLRDYHQVARLHLAKIPQGPLASPIVRHNLFKLVVIQVFQHAGI